MIQLFLAQHDPWEGHYPPETPMPFMGLTPGQLALSIIFSVIVQVLFGFWALSKAEEYDANPWLAFLAGFFLAYIGVRMVPALRRNALFFTPKPRPLGPPARGPALPGPNPYSQPIEPLPPPPPVHVSADGYLQCPTCSARAKADRKTCMTCGAPLPPM